MSVPTTKRVLEKRRSFSAVRQPGVVTCNHLRRRAGQDEGWEGFQNPGTCELEVVVGFLQNKVIVWRFFDMRDIC